MLEHLKKTVLAGLGALIYTEEKVEEVIRDLVAGGQLTREQGQKVLDELVERGRRGQAAVSEEFARRLSQWRPAWQSQIEALEARVAAIESRLGIDTPPAAPEAPPEDACGLPGCCAPGGD